MWPKITHFQLSESLNFFLLMGWPMWYHRRGLNHRCQRISDTFFIGLVWDKLMNKIWRRWSQTYLGKVGDTNLTKLCGEVIVTWQHFPINVFFFFFFFGGGGHCTEVVLSLLSLSSPGFDYLHSHKKFLSEKSIQCSRDSPAWRQVDRGLIMSVEPI